MSETPPLNGEPLVWLIVVMALVTMGSRFLGFFLVRPPDQTPLGRALHYLPYGLFAGIIIASAPTEGTPAAWLPVVGAALVTAWSAWRRHPLLLSLALGLGTALILGSLTS